MVCGGVRVGGDTGYTEGGVCVVVVAAVRIFFFFFQAEDGIRDYKVTGVQTCALPISWWGGYRNSFNTVNITNINVTNINIYNRGGIAPLHNGLRYSNLARINDRHIRSEERRVGKEGRSRWSPDH